MRIVCPSCKKVIEDAAEDFPPRPFCSARCKLLDLGNWFDESYRVSVRGDGEDGSDTELDN